ncbi:MAG: protein kinase [Sandaracinaceae bacterium]
MDESDTYLLDRGGTLLLGRYRVDELIGAGGMGSVWVAEQLALKQTVIVKFHESWSRAEDPERAIERFVREAKLLAQVRHRNVIALYEVGTTEVGEPFLIMERLSGNALVAHAGPGTPCPSAVARHHGQDRPRPRGRPPRLTPCASPRREAGEQSLPASRRARIVPKLLDFGLASSAKVSRLTDSGSPSARPATCRPSGPYGLVHRPSGGPLRARGDALRC